MTQQGRMTVIDPARGKARSLGNPAQPQWVHGDHFGHVAGGDYSIRVEGLDDVANALSDSGAMSASAAQNLVNGTWIALLKDQFRRNGLPAALVEECLDSTPLQGPAIARIPSDLRPPVSAQRFNAALKGAAAQVSTVMEKVLSRHVPAVVAARATTTTSTARVDLAPVKPIDENPLVRGEELESMFESSADLFKGMAVLSAGSLTVGALAFGAAGGLTATGAASGLETLMGGEGGAGFDMALPSVTG